MSSTNRMSLALLLVLAAVAAPAQDMVGPSDSPASEPAVAQPTESPETLTSPDPAAPAVSEVIGEDAVVRPAEDADVDATSADARPARAGDTTWTADDARYDARWKQHFDDTDYAAAAAVARSWVASVERSRDREDTDLFTPLVKLGRALEWAKDPVGAAVAFRRAVAIGEERFGVFDMRLSGALNALGRALFSQGRAEDAVPVLMRAKDITHRNRGIYNLEQENIVRSLAESYLDIGEPLQATREQRFIFGANQKSYGDDSVELVPALQRWAKWNVRVGRDAEARTHFRRALEILEEAHGPNDLRLVETLEMVANTYYKAAVTRWPREGARSLERVVEIYSSQQFVDQADLLRAQTRLGDWLMLASRPSEAVKAYGKAIQTATAAGMDPATIKAVFGYPRPLHGNSRPLNDRLGNLSNRFDDGQPRYVVLEFNVDARGRARNISVVEDTVGLVSVIVDVRERVHSTSFRPRFNQHGQPVATKGMRYRFELDTQGISGAPTLDAPGETQGEASSAEPVESAATATSQSPTAGN